MKKKKADGSRKKPATRQFEVQEIDVDTIRFTQRCVYDTFNENKAEGGHILELIDAILDGTLTPTDIPLIRVAWKQGAYWCIDNRRCFVYKHCRLGKMQMEVWKWDDNAEFQLKWKNGKATRKAMGDGRRVSVIQRTSRPFPSSLVADRKNSEIEVFMSASEQKEHDAKIARFEAKRRKTREDDERSAKRRKVQSEEGSIAELGSVTSTSNDRGATYSVSLGDDSDNETVCQVFVPF